MPNLCPCADLDWRDVDMSREHHPDCPIQAMIASGIDLDVIREVVDTLKTFDGFFDNIKVSDHALLADEVQNLYADTVKEAQPLAHLRLSETSSNQVMDSLDNERHGTYFECESTPACPNDIAQDILYSLTGYCVIDHIPTDPTVTVEGHCKFCVSPFKATDLPVIQLSEDVKSFEVTCPHCQKTMQGVIE